MQLTILSALRWPLKGVPAAQPMSRDSSVRSTARFNTRHTLLAASWRPVSTQSRSCTVANMEDGVLTDPVTLANAPREEEKTRVLLSSSSGAMPPWASGPVTRTISRSHVHDEASDSDHLLVLSRRRGECPVAHLHECEVRLLIRGSAWLAHGPGL